MPRDEISAVRIFAQALNYATIRLHETSEKKISIKKGGAKCVMRVVISSQRLSGTQPTYVQITGYFPVERFVDMVLIKALGGLKLAKVGTEQKWDCLFQFFFSEESTLSIFHSAFFTGEWKKPPLETIQTSYKSEQ